MWQTALALAAIALFATPSLATTGPMTGATQPVAAPVEHAGIQRSGGSTGASPRPFVGPSPALNVTLNVSNPASAGTGYYQQLLHLPSNRWEGYIAANWSNVNFTYANGTRINSWIEANATNSATNTLVWVDLANIPAHSYQLIYMDVWSLSTFVWSATGGAGIAPELTASYAKFDDGWRVFPFYDNFSGTSLKSSLGFVSGGGGGSDAVSNGLNLSASATGFAHVYSQSTVAANIVSAYVTAYSTLTIPGFAGFDTAKPTSSATNDGWATGYSVAYDNGNCLLLGYYSSGSHSVGSAACSPHVPFLATLDWYTANETYLFNHTSKVTSTDSHTSFVASYVDLFIAPFSSGGTVSFSYVMAESLPTGIMPTLYLPPQAPTNLVAVGRDANSVSMTWAAPPGAVTGYQVLYGTSCASLSVSGATASTGFRSRFLVTNTPYCFEVEASNATGYSVPSAPMWATPVAYQMRVGNVTTQTFGGGSSFSVTLAVASGNGIVVFAAAYTTANPIHGISDGTDGWELVSGSNQIGTIDLYSAVWVTYRASDSASNVPAGTRTITVTSSGPVIEMLITAVEVIGAGANGFIYFDTSTYGATNFGSSSSVTAAGLSGGAHGQPLFQNNPSSLSLMYVQEAANRTLTASTGTLVASQLNRSGSQYLSVAALASPPIFAFPLAETFAYGAAVSGNGHVISLYSTTPLAGPPPNPAGPFVAESELVYTNGAISGTTTTYAPVYASYVPQGDVLVVAVSIDQSGSQGRDATNVTDTGGDAWVDLGRAASTDSSSLPSNVVDVWETTTKADGPLTIEAKVAWDAPSPFYAPGGSAFAFFLVTGAAPMVIGTLGAAGGKTGVGGASATAGAPTSRTYVTVTATSIDSNAAIADWVALGPSGSGFGPVLAPTRSASYLLQAGTTSSSSSFAGGLNWTNATSSDTWAMAALAISAPAPPAPSLSCRTKPVAPGIVPPNLGDPNVLTTLSAASFTRKLNAYTETVVSRQCLTTFWVSATNETYWANVSTVSALSLDLERSAQASLSVLSNETWVNASGKCQAFYCFPNQTLCDSVDITGQLPRSRLFDAPCASVGIRYHGPLPLGGHGEYVNVTVSRVYVFLVTVGSDWRYPSALRASTAMNVTLVTPALLNASFGYESINGTTIPGNNETTFLSSAELAVPYPAGVWDPLATQVRYYSNASHAVTTFDQTLTDIVVAFRNVSSVQNLTISVFGEPGGTFGSGNQTVPLAITLALLNATMLPSGLTQESASWTNPYAGTFVGEIVTTGPWTSTAAHTNASVDGSPVLSVWTSASVDVLTGQVNVTNGTTITISVTFAVRPTFSATAPFLLFGTLGVGWVEILAVAAIAAGAVAYAVQRARGRWKGEEDVESKALTAATGTILLGLGFVLCLLI